MIETSFPDKPEIIVDTHIAKSQDDERLKSQSVSTMDAGADNPKNMAGRLIETFLESPTINTFERVLKEADEIGGEVRRLVWGFAIYQAFRHTDLEITARKALARCGEHGAERADGEIEAERVRQMREAQRNQPVIRECCGDH